MFEKIIFPTDFSEKARTELNCITGIPGIKEIILFHVTRAYSVPVVESLVVKAAENYLRKAKTFIGTLNPEIRVMLEEKTSSDIAGAILEKAEEHHVDLIVIHATMKGVMAGVLSGHVPSAVLCRTSKINIMIMPGKLVDTLSGDSYQKFCPMIFSRILCPTSFSDLSFKSIILAGNAKGAGEIILLHVVENGEGDRGPALKNAENRINEVCDRLTLLGIRSRTIVLAGKPETEIPRIAEEEDVSLVWMRSESRGCLHDFFFGSRVHDVIMNSTRPVIVIRSDR